MKHTLPALRALVIICAVAFSVGAQAAQRSFPVPQTVSPELQRLIAAPPAAYWNLHPKTAQEWKNWANAFDAAASKSLPQLREKMGVSVASEVLGGVPVFTFTPHDMPAHNAHRVLLHFHAGGYVLGAGESSTHEAIRMAGTGKFKVISVDYRMAPDFPYPAAIDDAMAAYRELLKTVPAQNIGVFGTSTGGGMTLILALRAKAEGLPLPAALAAGTPWSDMSKTGDSYFTNDGVDNNLMSYDGWVGDAARLYAKGHDLKDPMLSPVYGDVQGFPPTLLTSGTRDLFLSNTVRMHLKMRESGVAADLIVFEGMSHVGYLMLHDAPEARLYYNELSRFFDKTLNPDQHKQ